MGSTCTRCCIKMDNQQGPILYSMWTSAQCYVAAWTRGEFGGEWTHAYIWLSPFAVHLKLSQHCSSAILQHKIKSYFFKKASKKAPKPSVPKPRRQFDFHLAKRMCIQDDQEMIKKDNVFHHLCLFK